MNERLDKNCLSYWFHKIRAAGLPVPQTRIVTAQINLTPLCDGETPDGFGDFLRYLSDAAAYIGFPCFLRTGHGSGKHEWRDTCFVQDESKLAQHVFRLVEWSNTVDLMGLPTDVWAVRELIPTNPAFHAFRGMPIVREFRVFTRDDKATCVHPYWPEDSIHSASREDWRDRLVALSEITVAQRERLKTLAGDAAMAVDGGSWSVDFLEDAGGKWWLTDMALAERSFHWPGCDKT